MGNSVLTEHLISSKHSGTREQTAGDTQLKKAFSKFINIITFVDLPIRKKFLLFSFGVLFWFIVMFAISIAANIHVNTKTAKIVNQLVPLDRTTQKITRKLQSLSIDAAEIVNISNLHVLDHKLDISTARIADIQSFLVSLLAGGQVSDISRDDSRLIESFHVSGAKEMTGAGAFAKELRIMMTHSETILSEITGIKIDLLQNNIHGSSQLASKINEFKALIASSISLSTDFSVRLSKSYRVNSEKIEKATNITFYTFIGVLLLATSLLVIFTISISDSIVIPVKSIIGQIRSLGAGQIDMSKRIVIRSKDEIGLLSNEFNTLTKEIHDIVTFKKVIEEDHTIEDVYARLGKTFMEKCGLNEFTIYEVSGSQNKMRPVYPIILNDRDTTCSEEILSNCELCKVKKTGHTISSFTYNEICKDFKPGLDKLHLCLPMVIGGKTGGVVQFLFDDAESFDSNDKRLFKAEQYIKESLSVIEAKRLTNTLRESALKDPLTGLYNRRFLQEYTETLVAGVLRREKNVGLIMCDLDYFKQVNDTHGHNAGDSVLKETSNMILKCVRSSDLVIRFGGEEFLVLMLDINEGDTIKTAEKIRESFEGAKFKIPDGTIKKTISLGVSEFPHDTESFWQSIKFADVALYKAKDSGRNKAVRFNEEMWAGEEF